MWLKHKLVLFGVVIVLHAGVVPARGGCLDGQMQFVSVSSAFDTRVTSPSGIFFIEQGHSDEFGTFETDLADDFGHHATITTSLFEITASCSVPSHGSGTHKFETAAGGYVIVKAVGGHILITPTGFDAIYDNGTETLRPVSLMPSPIGPESGLYAIGCSCSASATTIAGGTSCSVTIAVQAVPPFSIESWVNPSGGSYHTDDNWDPTCAPEHNPPTRSVGADFLLATSTFIPISGSGATAPFWRIINSKVDFSGSAQTFSPTSSLGVFNQGELRLSGSGSLRNTGASIGTVIGNGDSLLEVIDSASWTSSGEVLLGRGLIEARNRGSIKANSLRVGRTAGPATVRVQGSDASLEIDRDVVVGDTHKGTLEIDQGEVRLPGALATLGVGGTAQGSIRVFGNDADLSTFGRLQVLDGTLLLEENGRLTVERGGLVHVARDLLLHSSGAGPVGELVVDPGSGTNAVFVDGNLFVGASMAREVLVQNHGAITVAALSIGEEASQAGAADVVLRGGAPGVPTLTVKGPDVGPSTPTLVGTVRPGLLSVEKGAKAFLNTGLDVGRQAGGTVSISSRDAVPPAVSRLTVTGVTNVGMNQEGAIQIDQGGHMTSDGDMNIGLSVVDPGGSVSVGSFSSLAVNGTLTVGAGGTGALSILAGSVGTRALVVGADSSSSDGVVVIGSFSGLTVNENTSVGVGAGHGAILIASSSSRLTVNGAMTIGGPGGGTVIVNGTIDGAGPVVPVVNGLLGGTGTVATTLVRNAGGEIGPGLSPGTLTIDGNLEIEAGSRIIIEYAGLNPGEFDVLRVTGQTTLGGQLEVHFIDGFSPPDPEAFIRSSHFIDTLGGVSGDYDERIYAFPDIFADFDNDGDKDLRDVAAFQNCFGRSGAGLLPECVRADWENNGIVNEVEVRELVARLDGADGIACPPGGSCPIVECDAAVIDNPACGGLDDADDDCYRGTCTPVGCVTIPEPIGSPCDDGIACTTRSVCGLGPTGFGCFAPDLADIHDALCPEQDFSDADCLRQVCDVALGCVAGVEPAGSLCDDGITCTTRSVCGSGPDGTGCLAQAPADLNHASCPDHDDEDADCIRDICDSVQGCIPGVESEGSACDDGVACTTRSVCESGPKGPECVADSEDFDHSICGNRTNSDADCLRGRCTSEGCIEENEPDQSVCDDGVACTDQFCSAGQCVSLLVDSNCGEFGDFDADCDHVYCTLDGCMPGFESDGSFCDDGLFCTASDLCSAGQCVGGASPCGEDSDADENCTRADCDEIEGCSFSVEPDGSPCDDGFVCSTQDHCVGSFCVSGAPIDPACEQQALCDEDCLRYFCQPIIGCALQDIEPESAPCFEPSCQSQGLFSACNVFGNCECRSQQPTDFGCPP